MGLIVLEMVLNAGAACALPSGGTWPPVFHQQNGDWYDSFGYDRNNYAGADGFLPNVAYESLGAYKEKAYSIGQSFLANYPDRVQRAEALMKFEQTWTIYGSDSDNIVIDGVHQEDFAWNGDEMAHMFNQTSGQVAIGDCEDMSFLGATLFIAAGFDVTMVSPSGHVAFMIWLPEYPNANVYWDLGDGRGQGWIWVEMTGKDNPLGWTPDDFTDGNFDIYPISASFVSSVSLSPENPMAADDVTVSLTLTVDAGNLTQVLLYYSVNSGPYSSVNMTLMGTTYQATIPKQVDGTNVAYYFSAMDAQGNVTESSGYSYKVGLANLISDSDLQLVLVVVAVVLVALFLLSRRRTSSNWGYRY